MAPKDTTIHRKKRKEDPYTRVPNRIVRDDRLTWKARGLLFYLLSLPDDWVIYVTELVKRAPDGKDSLVSGLNELRKYGYVTLDSKRDAKGRIMCWQYEVDDEPRNPESENPVVDDPEPEKPELEKPELGNPQLQITNSTNDLLLQITDTQKEASPHVCVFTDSKITELQQKIKDAIGVKTSDEEIKKWLQNFDETYILAKIKILQEQGSNNPIKSLRAAIRGDWQEPTTIIAAKPNSTDKSSRGMDRDDDKHERVVPAVQPGKYERFYQVYKRQREDVGNVT